MLFRKQLAIEMNNKGSKNEQISVFSSVDQDSMIVMYEYWCNYANLKYGDYENLTDKDWFVLVRWTYVLLFNDEITAIKN